MKTPTEVQADIIRELEAKISLLIDDLFYAKSENAALRNEIRQHEEQIEFLIGENTALQKQLEELGQSTQWFAEWAEKKQELERENAGLRKDKERLDWLNQKIVSSWLDGKDFVVWDKSSSQPCSIREWLDAAQKEAQP